MSDEIDHIEELQKRLYARDPESVPKRKFGILRPLKQNVSSSWGDTELPTNGTVRRASVSGYKRFFIVSFVFFLLALGAALFSVYRGTLTLSATNVDVTILGNSFIAGGNTLPLQVEIVNKNSADLLGATLDLDYPKGATDQAGSDVAHIQKVLGTIGSGKTNSQEFSIILYGEQGTTRTITAHLSYKLAGSSSEFQKDKTFSVLINSSPLALTVDGPAAVASNQSFELTLRNVFSGDKLLPNVLAHVDYPDGFVFDSSIPAPLSGNNVWALGDLENGTQSTITIKGKIVGQQGDQKAFRVYVGTPQSATDNTIAVTYNSSLHTLTLQQPFISADILVNGQKGDVVPVPISSAVTGSVSWTNNSGSRITSGAFTLALTGNDIDYGSVSADKGYYDAVSRTITWTTQSDPDLASIDVGQTGQLGFSFSTLTPTSNDLGSILALSVAGAFPDRDYAQQSVDTIDETTLRFAAHMQFASQAFYSVGAFKNTGPFPPKANQDTTYTVTWTAQPTENPLSNLKASATLPAGVVWVGAISPQAEPISYNPDSRLITWSAGVLPKVTAIPQTRSVSFQIKLRPTTAQVGTDLPLLGATTITANDAVANVPLTLTRPLLTTSLNSDPAYTPGKEKVLP